VHFAGSVNFNAVQFSESARFVKVQFGGTARFSAKFGGAARFEHANFSGPAIFEYALFDAGSVFRKSVFHGPAAFKRARFANNATFSWAEFNKDTIFTSTSFEQDVRFADAKLLGYSAFDGVDFKKDVSFERAQFDAVMFRGARFRRNVTMSKAVFSKVDFGRAIFLGSSCFDHVTFAGELKLDRTQFRKDANFNAARFDQAVFFGPISATSISFVGTVFELPAVMEIAAAQASFDDATWLAGVTLRLRYAHVSLERVRFTMPSSVSGFDRSFDSSTGKLNEYEVIRQASATRSNSSEEWMPVLTSLRGSESASLTVTDLDLSQCRFAGAQLLDHMRLEGRCVFDQPPRGIYVGWTWPPLWRWGNRQSISEERGWRAGRRKGHGWTNGPYMPALEISPERLAGLYRQLRKAQEDSKNEPGAADFYYGEMEMRRHSSVSGSDKLIVWLYWLVSGYGLRALRSLGMLAVLGLAVTFSLMGWGLASVDPVTAPPQHYSGTINITHGDRIHVNGTLNGAEPRLPQGHARWTLERARTALEVAVDSFAFRSTDQLLTASGVWTTIVARVLGPILIGLSLLAIRNRIKR
jgi:uncharacterized protein YjbI with pentapeptide repeats